MSVDPPPGKHISASYDPVAALYDQHWGNHFFIAAKAAFEPLLLHLLPPQAAVLDLCCGTGLVLRHLEQLGFHACGVDESSAMLAIARRNAPRARLQQADMAGFAFDTPFEAVVSFYNSLNHARSFEHLRATLVNVSNHLHEGGFFLFDYVLPEAFETAWECSEQIADRDLVCRLDYTYDRSAGHATCLINHQDQIRQIAIRPHQVREALAHAGLEVVNETAMTGPAPHGGRNLLLARKQ